MVFLFLNLFSLYLHFADNHDVRDLKETISIIYEKYPDEHKVTGKYKIFYILFAVTTLIFAILAAVLYVTCIDLFNKYLL